MKNTAYFFGGLLGGLALAFNNLVKGLTVRPSLGITALPVVPTADNELDLTLAVAKAIKPTETPGSLTDALLGARDPGEVPDAKTVIVFDADYKARVITLPSTAATDVVCIDDDAAPLGIITRDDTDSETSSHTQDIQPDGVANALTAAINEILAAEKPSRNLSSLINAIVDKAKKEGITLANVAMVHSTVGDGALTLYLGATVGTLAGKLADVTQGAAEAAAPRATRW